MSNQNKQLYIVISQTGTLLSRILKQITGAEYNHASISLSRDLERMYSFGRRHPYEDKKQRHREFALCRYMLYASYKPLTRYLLFCPVGVNGRRHTLPERS